MTNRLTHCLKAAGLLGAAMLLMLLTARSGFADDGESDRPDSVRDSITRDGATRDSDTRDGAGRMRNALRDGTQRSDAPLDGERFRSIRDRIRQGRPDGQATRRLGDGGPQGGRMAFPMFHPALDRNSDGRIDADELDLAVASLRTLDKNEDGQLTVEELLPSGRGAMGMTRPGMTRPGMGRPDGDRPGMDGRQIPSVEQMFAQLDKDGDGAISQQEAPERLRQNFDRADADGDGQLTKEEMQTARQRVTQMSQRGRDGRAPSNDPAGGTRPRRPEVEE